MGLLICCFWAISCHKNETRRDLSVENEVSLAENAVNINTASVAELEKLPHIGKKLAQKIIEHREKYGSFRKAEHLMLVPGISDERFRRLQNLIKIE